MIHKLTRYGVAEAVVRLTVYFNNLSVNAVTELIDAAVITLGPWEVESFVRETTGF